MSGDPDISGGGRHGGVLELALRQNPLISSMAFSLQQVIQLGSMQRTLRSHLRSISKCLS